MALEAWRSDLPRQETVSHLDEALRLANPAATTTPGRRTAQELEANIFGKAKSASHYLDMARRCVQASY